MLLKIGRSPEHDFDEPLGLLSDCHRRIEHFLWVLVALASERQGAELGDSERGQLGAALTYFSTAAPRHSEDEEMSLFPRLEASTDSAAAKAVALVRRLECDHVEAAAHHTAVDRIGRRWLADHWLPAEAVGELRGHLAQLQVIYKSHLAAEEHELFPAAARLLSSAEMQAIGREMAARRSIRPPAHHD
jgi:hemerythrin-like domain-containing protein